MKRKSIIGLLAMGILLASCQPTPSGPSTDPGFGQGEKAGLEITPKVYVNGVEDASGEYADIQVESRDDITGYVVLRVASKRDGYAIVNVIARDRNDAIVPTTRSSTFYESDPTNPRRKTLVTKLIFQLTNSDVTLNVVVGENAATSLSDENWKALINVADSPIFSASVSSQDLNQSLGMTLDFLAYQFVGQERDADGNVVEGSSAYTTAHSYYSGSDTEAFSFVKDADGNMARTYLDPQTNTVKSLPLYNNAGSIMKWDSTGLSNSSFNPYTVNPFQMATLSINPTGASGEALIQERITNLKSRFRGENVGDGTIKLTAVVDPSGFDFASNLAYVVMKRTNTVYSGNLGEEGANAEFEAIIDPDNHVVNSMKLTSDWSFDINNANRGNFTFTADFNAWSDGLGANVGFPGGWTSDNASIASIYKPLSSFKPADNSGFASGAKGAEIKAQKAIAEIAKGNYTVDVSALTISADGLPAGLGTEDRPFEGSVQVALADADQDKGVYSTLPTIQAVDNTTGAATFFNAGALGKVDAVGNVAPYGLSDLATAPTSSARLTRRTIASSAFFKGGTKGFLFGDNFLGAADATTTQGHTVFSRNFKAENKSSVGLNSKVLAEFANPLDFAFGQPADENDAALSGRYGALGTQGQMKDISFDFYEVNGAPELLISFTGWIRAFGSNLEYKVKYRYHSIGTTALSAEVKALLNGLAA